MMRASSKLALSAVVAVNSTEPPGMAHGFQTLTDRADVFYQITEFYQPELSQGVRWNDPAFGIRWPIPSPMRRRFASVA